MSLKFWITSLLLFPAVALATGLAPSFSECVRVQVAGDLVISKTREDLARAVQSGGQKEVILDSGIAVEGKLAKTREAPSGATAYLHFEGPTRLKKDGVEIAGQGVDQHPQGFGSPVGLLEDGSNLANFSEADLKRAGIEPGKDIKLQYQSGVIVEGHVTQVQRGTKGPMLLSFDTCKVTLGADVLFDPSWGAFDMVVGGSVKAVTEPHAGSEDFRIDVTYTGFLSYRSLKEHGSLIGRYAEVKFGGAEFSGKIVKQYGAGFDLVDTKGLVHELNGNYHDFEEIRIRPASAAPLTNQGESTSSKELKPKADSTLKYRNEVLQSHSGPDGKGNIDLLQLATGEKNTRAFTIDEALELSRNNPKLAAILGIKREPGFENRLWMPDATALNAAMRKLAQSEGFDSLVYESGWGPIKTPRPGEEILHIEDYVKVLASGHMPGATDIYGSVHDGMHGVAISVMNSTPHGREVLENFKSRAQAINRIHDALQMKSDRADGNNYKQALSDFNGVLGLLVGEPFENTMVISHLLSGKEPYGGQQPTGVTFSQSYLQKDVTETLDRLEYGILKSPTDNTYREGKPSPKDTTERVLAKFLSRIKNPDTRKSVSQIIQKELKTISHTSTETRQAAVDEILKWIPTSPNP